MKKVVLYNPEALFFDMPLALLSIASVLDPSEFEVIIIDARIEENAHSKLIECCEDAFCLGVTVLSGSPLKDALYATRLVKSVYPELKTVWGGWHPSLFASEILQEEDSVDITVYGQGEVTFSELIKALNDNSDLKEINGIAFRRNGDIIKTPARLMSNMNDLPPVNYDLIDIERYFKAKGKRQFDYISSTGCFFRCSFCADPFVFKRKWTSIEPKRLVSELKHWQNKYGFTDVNFQDETFFTYKKRSTEIAEEFIDKKLNISWAATMRADQGSRLDHEDFKLLKRSGLRRVLIGVESGSQEMMDWLKKDIKLEQVLDCADKCSRLKITVQFPFIVGFPGESDKSVKASMDFIKKLRKISPKFYTPIFYYKPYPGTAITEDAVKSGYQLPNNLQDWSEFDFVDAKGGPWVDKEKYNLIESFKFYSSLAWRDEHWISSPIRTMARWRCEKDFYKLPLEKYIINRLRRKIELS
jgi:radical SAM superfamily enzyme YgiQ (UPF0313 family)